MITAVKTQNLYIIHLIILIFVFENPAGGTHGVPGGKVNILGGHSIGHSKQKSIYVHASYSERFLYSSKIVDKKEMLHTVSNTGIYCYK
jgi:hypothetical protein